MLAKSTRLPHRYNLASGGRVVPGETTVVLESELGVFAKKRRRGARVSPPHSCQGISGHQPLAWLAMSLVTTSMSAAPS